MNERPTVMIVDDDHRNIFALGAVLRSKGYKVVSAGSAAEGLQLLQRNEAIRIVLMDIMMPDMDGYEAIRRIRSGPGGNEVLVVAVTAQAMKGDREKCLEAGANSYVSKPVDVDVLLAIMEPYKSTNDPG
jgi:CheY-like chemotaxis protein